MTSATADPKPDEMLCSSAVMIARARAARRIAAWLKERQIPLSDHEVNLLVESLVHAGKGSRWSLV